MNGIILNPMSVTPERWPVQCFYRHHTGRIHVGDRNEHDMTEPCANPNWQCIGWTYPNAAPEPVVTVARLEKKASEYWQDAEDAESSAGFLHERRVGAAEAIEHLITEAKVNQ